MDADLDWKGICLMQFFVTLYFSHWCELFCLHNIWGSYINALGWVDIFSSVPVLLGHLISYLPFPDVASADQQKAAGAHKDQDEDQNDEDVAMETDKQEEDLQAAEVQELKPEQLDSTKASQKGDAFKWCS